MVAGLHHSLSKRTQLFAAYGRMTNTPRANMTCITLCERSVSNER